MDQSESSQTFEDSQYDLHPLAIEDIFHVPQRIKCDQHEEHITIPAHSEARSHLSSVLFGRDMEYLKCVGFNIDDWPKTRKSYYRTYQSKIKWQATCIGIESSDPNFLLHALIDGVFERHFALLGSIMIKSKNCLIQSYCDQNCH
ncbi:hypothetical protein BC833DRAFT_569216 [Globomyces pollinis-pini]|nr:hypothetical protein BC833DRAFT_569216 [Globomyces pollinis-pini]